MTGNQIRKIRERIYLDRRAFGDVLGVNQSTVYRWEACGSKAAKVEGLPARILKMCYKADTLPDYLRSSYKEHGPLYVLRCLLIRAL